MKWLFVFNLAYILICGTSGEYCLKMGNITNGNVACSEGNMVGSVCSFTCNEVDGYKLFPLTLTTSTCLNNREWDEGRPCCARGCPRYAVMDLVIVLDSSSSVGQQNWEIMKSFVREIINTFEVSSTATRIAVFRYNKEIDTTSQILLSDFPDDKQALLKKYNAIPYDGSGTKTGQALSHVLNVVLSTANGNRPDVKDVILTITDGRSFDDVSQPSLQLRNQGALTYVLGILPSNGLGLDDEQLDVIAGSSERLLVANAGFSGLNQDFAARIGQQICGKPCAITCQPHPSQPMNGYVSCTDRNVVGSKCNFRCKEGFALVGAANMTCDDDLDGDDGVWSAVAPTCQQITCNPVQESPINGDMTCTKTNLVGSICFFACDQGYELVGATDSVCNEVNGAVDGTWTNQAPRCERKVCPEAPAAPTFGTRTCTDGINLISQCEYMCNENYILSGARYSTCVEDINGVRTFDNDAPTCTPTKCPVAAPAPVNGFKICSNENEFGSVCEYGCNIGYRSIGPLIAVCGRTADGTLRFNDTAPICQAIQCPQQSKILNGQVSCTDSNTYDSTCTFQCDQSNGYSLYPSGHSRTTCLSNSSWSWASPCCSRPCLNHSVIDMIFILDSSSSVGSDNWDVMKNFVRDVINLLSITETGTRVSIFRYNRRPDRQSQILLNDHIGDKQGLLSALDQMPYNGRGTWIGNALNHAKDFILQLRNGDRPDVIDVVLTITDGRSKDDVSVVSEELRKQGALTYAVGVIPPNGKGPREEELLKIAGSTNRVKITTSFEGTKDHFEKLMSDDLCGSPCDVQCNPRHVTPANGQMRCTNDNMEGSRCTFSCDSVNFKLQGEELSVCKDDNGLGVWTAPTPVCKARCSTFGFMDLVVVLDSSSSFGKKNWAEMKMFIRQILSSFDISLTATRAAVFRYNSMVYNDSQILLSDFPTNKPGLLEAYDAIVHNGRGTMTGQALKYVNDTILADVAGNRPEAVDVVLTVTDGRSVDDVTAISDSLRQRGALTYAIGVIPPNKKGADRDQLLSIAGEANNIFLAINNFDGVFDKFIGKLDEDLCG